MKLRDLIESIVALFVFASAYSLIRIALVELPPLTVGAIRFILASALMVPIVIVRYRGTALGIRRENLPILLGLSVLQVFIPNFLQNIGLVYTTASVSSVLQSTTPVFTLILSSMFLKESFGRLDFLGVMLGMAGVVLLSTHGNPANLAGSVFLGNAMQVGVAASYAVSGILGKVVLRKYPPTFIVTITFVVSAILLGATAIVFESSLWPGYLSNRTVVALLLLSFLYCLGLVAWYDVLQRMSVFRLYVLLFAMPVLAVIISVAVLLESFTVADVLFSALTLLGVGIAQYGKRT